MGWNPLEIILKRYKPYSLSKPLPNCISHTTFTVGR